MFDEVELWTGKARNTRELSEIKDVFGYYNIEKPFSLGNFFNLIRQYWDISMNFCGLI